MVRQMKTRPHGVIRPVVSSLGFQTTLIIANTPAKTSEISFQYSGKLMIEVSNRTHRFRIIPDFFRWQRPLFLRYLEIAPRYSRIGIFAARPACAGPGSIRCAHRAPQIPKSGCRVSALRVTIPRADNEPLAGGSRSRVPPA